MVCHKISLVQGRWNDIFKGASATEKASFKTISQKIRNKEISKWKDLI